MVGLELKNTRHTVLFFLKNTYNVNYFSLCTCCWFHHTFEIGQQNLPSHLGIHYFLALPGCILFLLKITCHPSIAGKMIWLNIYKRTNISSYFVVTKHSDSCFLVLFKYWQVWIFKIVHMVVMCTFIVQQLHCLDEVSIWTSSHSNNTDFAKLY